MEEAATELKFSPEQRLALPIVMRELVDAAGKPERT
jgi:hypothetical protein